ncbi:MAG: hypothetical protein ACLTXI_05335 [Collinsella sp.]
MAPKNLLPVAALCSALATGTPLAAWATPAVVDSLPIALSPAPAPPSTIACKQFSLAQAAISTSGCLYRDTDGSIVVDLERPDKENGPRAGRAICTWTSAAIDTDGDLCDVMLCIDIASTNDSANGAKVAFDSATHEEGGVCLGCVVSHADGAQPALIHGIVADNQSQHRRRRNGRDPLLFYADNAEGAKIKDDKQNGSLSLTRGRNSAYRDRCPNARQAARTCRPGAPRNGMEWSWSHRGRPLCIERNGLPIKDGTTKQP